MARRQFQRDTFGFTSLDDVIEHLYTLDEEYMLLSADFMVDIVESTCVGDYEDITPRDIMAMRSLAVRELMEEVS